MSERTTVLKFILLYLPIGTSMGMFQSPNNSAIMGAARLSKSVAIFGGKGIGLFTDAVLLFGFFCYLYTLARHKQK